MKEPKPGHVQVVLLLAFLSLFSVVNVLLGESAFGPIQGPTKDAPATFPASSTPHG